MFAEKTFTIEFLQTGGIINFEHNTIFANMRLYRYSGQNINSILVMVSGFILIALSIYDI